MRIVFMGTGEFALPAFRALVHFDHDVVGLVTQPDRTAPGGKSHPHPMKEQAISSRVPVMQPTSINTTEAVDAIKAFDADLAVVAAYGQILKPDVLSATRLGAVNLHASILPRYRGAAPIQHAIANGETETGVTIFQIEPKLDAGPILDIVRCEVPFEMTAGELHDQLAEMSAPQLLRVLQAMETAPIKGKPQDASLVTKAPRLKKTDGHIDWTQTAEGVHNHIRAMIPWPKPYAHLHHQGRTHRLIIPSIALSQLDQTGEPGEIVAVDKHHVVVATGDGCVEIRRIQPEGKRVMTIDEFLAGHAVGVGDRLT